MTELVPLCTLTLGLGPFVTQLDGPLGRRSVLHVPSVAVEGERITAHLKDYWTDASIQVGDVVTLSVRGVIETDDGATIYVSYQGRADVTKTPTYYYCAPYFETDDPRYAWLNGIQAVGRGAIDGGVLVYEWFEVR